MANDIPARREALRAARFPVWRPATLSQFLRRCAAEYGERPFVISDDGTMTYSDADTRATAVVTAEELTALCKDKLARFKVPKHFLLLEPPTCRPRPQERYRSTGWPSAPPTASGLLSSPERELREDGANRSAAREYCRHC